MMRSLFHWPIETPKQSGRRRRHRRLEFQALEEKKMMTVATCLVPIEVAAIVAQFPPNDPAGEESVAGDQHRADQKDAEQNGGPAGEPSSEGNSHPTTTVQLPTFTSPSVSTTVSVPDGGTVLLGGIKRLSEARNEAGVPVLNKIPYVSRLFKNISAGRESTNLMLMVTPRIIIQEEE